MIVTRARHSTQVSLDRLPWPAKRLLAQGTYVEEYLALWQCRAQHVGIGQGSSPCPILISPCHYSQEGNYWQAASSTKDVVLGVTQPLDQSADDVVGRVTDFLHAGPIVELVGADGLLAALGGRKLYQGVNDLAPEFLRE